VTVKVKDVELIASYKRERERERASTRFAI
jgi:hypothetical protein